MSTILDIPWSDNVSLYRGGEKYTAPLGGALYLVVSREKPNTGFTCWVHTGVGTKTVKTETPVEDLDQAKYLTELLAKRIITKLASTLKPEEVTDAKT